MIEKYKRPQKEDLKAEYKEMQPEPITYRYAGQCVILTGFLAGLYRGMIWMYGEEEAKVQFWLMFHKKKEPKLNENGVHSPVNAVKPL